jgi:hypothetical protein
MTRAFKYILPFTLYGLAILAFTKTGVYTWLPLVYAFIVIPMLEIMVKPASNNLSAIEEDILKVNPVYDYILYAVVVFQFVALWLFLNSMVVAEASLSDTIGRVIAMGLLCGIFGINASLPLKFFAGKDRQDRQYDEHCDLIGKGDGQEIVRYAYYQRCKANPHEVATPRNKFGHHKDEPEREPEPMRRYCVEPCSHFVIPKAKMRYHNHLCLPRKPQSVV